MAARGYGITQQDMVRRCDIPKKTSTASQGRHNHVRVLLVCSQDASRLVFVSVQSAKPRRKVAVPVPDGYTWQDFVQQVHSNSN